MIYTTRRHTPQPEIVLKHPQYGESLTLFLCLRQKDPNCFICIECKRWQQWWPWGKRLKVYWRRLFVLVEMQEYLPLLPVQQLNASFVCRNWLFLRFRFILLFFFSARQVSYSDLSAVPPDLPTAVILFQYYTIWKSVNILYIFNFFLTPYIVQLKLTSTLSLTSIPPSLSSSSCLWMCRSASRLKRSASPMHGGITMRQGSTAGTPTQKKKKRG